MNLIQPKSQDEIAPPQRCVAIWCPELAALMPAVRRSPLVVESWDDPTAWHCGAMATFATRIERWIEFAVCVLPGQQWLAQAAEVLDRMWVVEARIFAAQPPMAVETIQWLKPYNARLSKDIWSRKTMTEEQWQQWFQTI